MPAPFARKKRNSQGKSWLKDLEEFHTRVDSVCRSLDRFTPAEFQGHFGFIEPMNHGYKSLEDLFVMRGCDHEDGGVFIYKGITCPIQPSSANGNEVFEYPKMPQNVPLGRLIQYYIHVGSVMRQLKRFSLSEFEEKFDPKAHENYGFYSVEHVLSFRGCQRTGEEFVYDEVIALQAQALAVASYFEREFSEFEFKSVYRRLYLTNQLPKHLLKCGFDSLCSLLKSLGGVEIHGFGHDQGYVKYVLLKSDRRESQGPMDVQARTNTKQKAPVPSEVVEIDSSDNEIEILHENIATKKRFSTANEEEAASDGDGEPVVKKKKHAEPPSPRPSETLGNANTNPASEKADLASVHEEEKEEDVETADEPAANGEADSAVESSAIPTDPSEANPAEMDQSIQKEGAMVGNGDPVAGCSTSRLSEASSADSDDEALIERMNRYHNEFLNAVITGAMKKGVDPEDLGKKVLDRIFEKNPEP